jgi:hypothetical protein
MRKIIWIPVVAMANRPERLLLELVIERGNWPSESLPGLSGLAGLNLYGLGNAAKIAENALKYSQLLSHFSWYQCRTTPYFYTAQTVPTLSNTSGAALGIALGLLMYEGYLPNEKLIACGGLSCAAGVVTIQTIDKIKEKLELALDLGWQNQKLPCVVPAYLQDGLQVEHCFNQQIEELKSLNIYVLPSKTLQDAVRGCMALTKEI